jgi:hypothetical protein
MRERERERERKRERECVCDLPERDEGRIAHLLGECDSISNA